MGLNLGLGLLRSSNARQAWSVAVWEVVSDPVVLLHVTRGDMAQQATDEWSSTSIHQHFSLLPPLPLNHQRHLIMFLFGLHPEVRICISEVHELPVDQLVTHHGANGFLYPGT